MMNFQMILFYIFGFLAIASAVGVITCKNTVHCAVSLLLTFISVAALFVLLEAEFLAAVQVYIYAGAIMVLVIFVIMLVNIKESLSGTNYVSLTAASLFIGIGLFLIFLFVVTVSNFYPLQGIYSTAYQVANGGQSKLIGKLLFTEYVFPFEVASILLLVAMIGAIVLPTRRRHRREDKGKGEIL